MLVLIYSMLESAWLICRGLCDKCRIICSINLHPLQLHESFDRYGLFHYGLGQKLCVDRNSHYLFYRTGTDTYQCTKILTKYAFTRSILYIRKLLDCIIHGCADIEKFIDNILPCFGVYAQLLRHEN